MNFVMQFWLEHRFTIAIVFVAICAIFMACTLIYDSVQYTNAVNQCKAMYTNQQQEFCDAHNGTMSNGVCSVPFNTTLVFPSSVR